MLMKEKHPNNGLSQSRKICVVFQKELKTTTSTPHPSLQQSRRYFRAEKVTCLQQIIKVTKRSVYRSP